MNTCNECEHLTLSMELMADQIKNIAQRLDRKSIKKTIEYIMGADSIFIMGAGRSGLVGKAFAMRLMHLGFTSYVVGESTTPAVHKTM